MTATEWLKAYRERNGTITLDTILEEAEKLIEGIDEAENEELDEDYFEETSKIFKFSGYYIDTNSTYDNNDVEAHLENGTDMITQHIKVESADIGEWDDDNPLNFDDCDIKECEKWFE